jgi:hypothetical protein
LAALRTSEVKGIGGHGLLRIGGWAPGFRSAGYCRHGPYRWLDGEHLLIFPVVSIATEEWGAPEYTQPVVAALDGTAAWALGSARPSCELPEWSASLERLISAEEGSVQLWDLAGNPAGTYPGQEPLHLAPSGRRLLAGQTWIDLDSGRTVSPLDLHISGPHKPGWTADERRVFTCCFSYADISRGQQWHQAEFPGFYLGGRGSWPGEETWSISYWLPGESRTMLKTYAIWPTAVDDPRSRQVILLFDPVAQRYDDLVTVLGLETPPYCWAEPAPDGRHAWLGCLFQERNATRPHDLTYVVDLQTLQPVTVTGRLEMRGWSADGRYLAASEIPDPEAAAGTTWVVDVAGNRLQAADAPAAAVIWHASQATAALRFADERRLRFYDAESGLARDLLMERPITEIAWQPAGRGLAFTTGDGRVWWLADALDGNRAPQSVTEPLPGLHSLKWSPDDGWLAFVSESDLNVLLLSP